MACLLFAFMSCEEIGQYLLGVFLGVAFGEWFLFLTTVTNEVFDSCDISHLDVSDLFVEMVNKYLSVFDVNLSISACTAQSDSMQTATCSLCLGRGGGQV